MKTTKDKTVRITIKGPDSTFVARIPKWKAYLILADLEKHEADKASDH